MKEKISKAIFAIRCLFFVCGLALSSWAPLVPYAKLRLKLNDAQLGTLLLLLGTGAITMMPICGYLSQKYGNRIIIAVSAVVIAITLPLLSFVESTIVMGAALLLFGAGIGTVDVAMNACGVHIQKLYGKPILSSLHGLFSIGGLFGSVGVGVLIKLGTSPFLSVVSIVIVLLIIMFFQYKNLFSAREEITTMITEEDSDNSHKRSALWMHPGVLFIGFLCFIVFMVEGAMLDWSALFLTEVQAVPSSMSGLGYASFSVAMALMRLFGDRIVEKLSPKIVVVGGGLLSGTGLGLAIVSPYMGVSLLGFFVLGCGAANIVPVFFNETSRFKTIKASTAVAVISTMGYSGQLLGPVAVGYIASATTLSVALLICAVLVAATAVLSYLFLFKNKTENINNTTA